jgi:chemotaxis protein methyltransferase CheR
MAADPETEAIEVRMLLEAINAKYGYDLRGYTSSSMHRRVMAALSNSGLAHLGELQHRVLTDPAFFATVLDDLTIRVSEMFRDPGFYRALRARVVPLLRTYPLLRIWHGGCATGEEVFSNAILLTEEGLYERTQLYATDLSPVALEQARQGVFTAEHLPAFRDNYAKAGGEGDFARYVSQVYDRIVMKQSLSRNVLFFQHNLVSDHAFAEMHVIFCRNVLIYFGEALRQRVMEKFAQSLCSGGFLCLGSSERLSRDWLERGFVEFAPAERIYRYEG